MNKLPQFTEAPEENVDVNFWNYHIEYSSTGTVNRDLSSDCCFRYITKYHSEEFMDNVYEIYIPIGVQYFLDTENNCFCLGTEAFVKKHLFMLKQYVNFEYKVETVDRCYSDDDDDEDSKSYEFYHITLHINASYIKHKFVLTMVRALYEFPYNMAYFDVKRLREMPEFFKYTSINLYKITSGLAKLIYVDTNDDQSLVALGYTTQTFKFAKFYTKDATITLLNEAENKGTDASLHELFEYKTLQQDDCGWEELVGAEGGDTTDYWLDEEKFQQRVEVYRNIISNLK